MWVSAPSGEWSDCDLVGPPVASAGAVPDGGRCTPAWRWAVVRRVARRAAGSWWRRGPGAAAAGGCTAPSPHRPGALSGQIPRPSLASVREQRTECWFFAPSPRGTQHRRVEHPVDPPDDPTGFFWTDATDPPHVNQGRSGLAECRTNLGGRTTVATDEVIQQRLWEAPEDEAVKERLEREHGELLEELHRPGHQQGGGN